MAFFIALMMCDIVRQMIISAAKITIGYRKNAMAAPLSTSMYLCVNHMLVEWLPK